MRHTFAHTNFNVLDLDRSIAFYEKALGLSLQRKNSAADGSFTIAFLGDGVSSFALELTWVREHPEPYDLGEAEFHLAFVSDDYDASHKLHSEMGCICFENEAMGIYFIEDPDGYWIEILPAR